MKLRLPLIACSVAILAFVLHACMKEFEGAGDGNALSSGSDVISVDEARAFFQKTYLNNTSRSVIQKCKKLNPGDFTPNWGKARTAANNKAGGVLTPIYSQYGYKVYRSYFRKGKAEAFRATIYQKLLVVKNRKSGRMNQYIVTYAPSATYAKRNEQKAYEQFLNLGENSEYSGMVVYSTVESNTPVKIDSYIRGKKVHSISRWGKTKESTQKRIGIINKMLSGLKPVRTQNAQTRSDDGEQAPPKDDDGKGNPDEGEGGFDDDNDDDKDKDNDDKDKDKDKDKDNNNDNDNDNDNNPTPPWWNQDAEPDGEDNGGKYWEWTDPNGIDWILRDTNGDGKPDTKDAALIPPVDIYPDPWEPDDEDEEEPYSCPYCGSPDCYEDCVCSGCKNNPCICNPDDNPNDNTDPPKPPKDPDDPKDPDPCNPVSEANKAGAKSIMDAIKAAKLPENPKHADKSTTFNDFINAAKNNPSEISSSFSHYKDGSASDRMTEIVPGTGTNVSMDHGIATVANIHSHPAGTPPVPSAKDLWGICDILNSGTSPDYQASFAYQNGDMYALYVENRADAIKFFQTYKDMIYDPSDNNFINDPDNQNNRVGNYYHDVYKSSALQGMSAAEKMAYATAAVLDRFDTGIRLLHCPPNNGTPGNTFKQFAPETNETSTNIKPKKCE